jgi:hypothetical protein
MRVKPLKKPLFTGAVALTAVVSLQLSGLNGAFAGTSDPVSPTTVADLRAEAVRAQVTAAEAATASAKAAARLADAKAQTEAEQAKAAAAQAKYEASGLESDKKKADDAAARAATFVAKQAELQLDADAKAAKAASTAAAAAAAVIDADRESESLAQIDGGTTNDRTTSIPDSSQFPDNAIKSDNVEVVGNVRGVVGANPSCPAYKATKCPAFAALNFIHYEGLGYDMMVANGTGGLSIWSLKDPAKPVHVGALTVDQLRQPGETMTQFWEGENLTVDSKRKLVFLSRDSGNKGLFIIDVKDPWNPRLVNFHRVPQGHTATCLNDCRFIWSVGGVQSGSGTGFTGKSSPVSVTDIRDIYHPFTYPTAFVSDVRRTGATSGSTHSVDVDFEGVAWVAGSGGVRGYWTQGKHYDAVAKADRWATAYDPIPYGGGSIKGNDTSFLHNAYRMPHDVGGYPRGDVMLVTNEANNQSCARAGVFIIASLDGTVDPKGITSTPQNPAKMNRLSTYSPGGKPAEFVGGDCSAHWFTVKGNIVAQGFYEQGIRFVDVSDPTNPQQVGHFRVPDRAASGDTPAILGSMASAAYWHGDYVYVADYGRGVDILKFTDPFKGRVESKVCWNSCEK